MNIKNILATGGIIVAFILNTNPVFAHVVVKPNEANVASFQTFTIGVPNELNVPVTGLKLIIPAELKNVSPNVKPGWTISIKKNEQSENPTVTEINWTGGSIPVGQRDDFLFSAQVPANETSLIWKAYQTYQNGKVISWDQAPVSNQTDEQKEENEAKGLGPYSQTKVLNDLKASSAPMKEDAQEHEENDLGKTLAIFLASLSIGWHVRNLLKEKGVI